MLLKLLKRLAHAAKEAGGSIIAYSPYIQSLKTGEPPVKQGFTLHRHA